MLSSRARGLSGRLTAIPVRVLVRTPLTPTAITLVGFLLAALAAALAARGTFVAAGLVYLVGSLFDLLDGTLARARGQATTLGALLDSIFDRFSEAVLLLGLLLFYLRAGAEREAAVIFVAAFLSVMVSYVRARAEGLGLSCEVGVLARPERVVLLSGGMILGVGVLPWALWLLAGLGLLTVAQRVFHVWRQARAVKG